MTQHKENREKAKASCCSKRSMENNANINLQETNGTWGVS